MAPTTAAGPVRSPAQPVAVYESSVTIPTYQYGRALVADPKDAIYPYERLDFPRVGPPEAKTYRTVVLESRYLKISILPQLGGRIYSLVFKPTGHDLFYRNRVIKPSRFGYRGWWLATGGTEFALPTDEHGLSEYVPWQDSVVSYPDGSAAVTVWDIEKTTKTRVDVEIKLASESAAYTLTSRLANTSTSATRIQYWINAMLAPGGSNHVSPSTEFVIPASEATVHSTGDRTLPQAGDVVRWPVHEGRDLSRFGNWATYLGLFVRRPTADFAGAYNHDAGEGVVRVFPGDVARGLKLFAFGRDFSAASYTDDGSTYFELWGGLTPTFWDYYHLQPGSSVQWTETWYPIHQIGGLTYANGNAALSIQRMGSTDISIGVMPVLALDGARIVIEFDGRNVYDRIVSISPDFPFLASIGVGSGQPGNITVSVIDRSGAAILRYAGRY